MRIRTYCVEARSYHFDVLGRGNDPWSVDLVVEAVSFLLLGSFVCALVPSAEGPRGVCCASLATDSAALVALAQPEGLRHG